MVEAPVGLDGGNLRVVVVVVAVGGADKVLGHGVADQDRQHAVLDGIGLVLVESDEHQRVLHELRVLEQRGDEVRGPGAGGRHRGVVALRENVSNLSSIARGIY